MNIIIIILYLSFWISKLCYQIQDQWPKKPSVHRVLALTNISYSTYFTWKLISMRLPQKLFSYLFCPKFKIIKRNVLPKDDVLNSSIEAVWNHNKSPWHIQRGSILYFDNVEIRSALIHRLWGMRWNLLRSIP